MFDSVSEGQGGESGIISDVSKFLAISQLMVNFNKSLLVFFLQFYILAFSMKKNFKRIHQLVSDVQRRLQQHDCF